MARCRRGGAAVVLRPDPPEPPSPPASRGAPWNGSTRAGPGTSRIEPAMLRPARNRPRAGDRRAPGSQARPRRRPLLLDLEPLESRRLLTGPITVTTNDGGTGAGTLYAAIEEANSVSPDVI